MKSNNNIFESIKNNVNTIGTHAIENVMDFFDFKYRITKESFNSGCYQIDIWVESEEYHVKINYNADVYDHIFECDDCQDEMAEYIYGVYEDFMQYVNDMKYYISEDVNKMYKEFADDEEFWDANFEAIDSTYRDEIDAFGFSFEDGGNNMFKDMWHNWYLECIDRKKFASNVEGDEDDNDPNVKMMADIIYFIKNGPDSGDMILNNPAIGVGIRILKDWDFFDVMVATEDGKQSYTDSFSVEIDEFTEVFDFIFGSIDKIIAKA